MNPVTYPEIKLTDHTMLLANGGRIIEAREGYALGELPLGDTVQQPLLVYHAGAIVMLADEVASTAIHGEKFTKESTAGNLFPYLVQASVSFLSNDPVGPIRAEAKVVRKGKLLIVDTTVTSVTGAVVALMRSTHKTVHLARLF